MRCYRFVPPGVRLRVDPMLRFHRYRDLDRVPPAVLKVAHAMVAEAEGLVEPLVVFTRRPVAEMGADRLALRDGPTFHAPCLGVHLAGATEAVCFVATIGPRLDERTEALADANDLLEALFLDCAGWLAIEDMIQRFRAHLGAPLRRTALRLSPRLAPGYLDWPLTEQALLFTVFNGAALPVVLNEYCVMSPKKSISGIFGVVPRDQGAGP